MLIKEDSIASNTNLTVAAPDLLGLGGKPSDNSSIPSTLRNVQFIPESQAVRTRDFTFDLGHDMMRQFEVGQGGINPLSAPAKPLPAPPLSNNSERDRDARASAGVPLYRNAYVIHIGCIHRVGFTFKCNYVSLVCFITFF